MRIATWNVNSLAVRLPQVLDWLIAQPVDVLCLQELKLTDDKFPLDALKSAGYEAHAFGQKTYNGVAILSLAPMAEVSRNIAGFEDEQSRVITATIDAAGGPVRVINGYFVNGQEPGSEKFAYKMRWLDALRAPGRAGGRPPRYLMRRLQPYLVSVRSREAARYRQRGLLGDVVPGTSEWRGDYDEVLGLTGDGLNPDSLVV